DVALREKIEDVRPAVEAARLERVFFLGEIELRDVLEGDVVEIEVAAEFQRAAQKLRQPAAENPPARERARQPAQRPQRAKRRARRIVDEVAPVAVLRGPAAGEDRRDARRAETEDGAQFSAMRREA